MRSTFGKDVQAGVSADQYAAQKIGGQTRYASLELGCLDQNTRFTPGPIPAAQVEPYLNFHLPT
jgi:hypothetical protein